MPRKPTTKLGAAATVGLMLAAALIASTATLAQAPTTPPAAIAPAPTLAPAATTAPSPAAPALATPSKPPAPGAEPVTPETSIATATLPHDLSPWGMFLNADIVVKVVMLGLLFASLVTWTVWLAKTFEIGAAKRQARAGVRILQEARSLADADQQFGERDDAVARLVQTASAEVRLSANASGEGLKERIAWLLERLEVTGGRRVGRGMGVLASIGATAPFVGLFGTVWGIMNSFIGISNAHTTNLAVVAPGIAEALLATALGLFAAIPAVVIYNVFARSIGGYRALLADAGALVMRLVSRDERARATVARRGVNHVDPACPRRGRLCRDP